MQKNQEAPKGFHRLSIEERLDQIASMTELGQDEIQCLKKFGNLPEETANGMVENVIGVMGIPFGVATNLILDGKEILVPMATEESSVIAAVCNASKQCRSSGGVTSSVSGSEMIVQIQLLGCPIHIMQGKSFSRKKKRSGNFVMPSTHYSWKTEGGFATWKSGFLKHGEEPWSSSI